MLLLSKFIHTINQINSFISYITIYHITPRHSTHYTFFLICVPKVGANFVGAKGVYARISYRCDHISAHVYLSQHSREEIQI